LQALLAAVAGFGLLITFIALFVGIFVVWFPTVWSMKKLSSSIRGNDFWKIALTGAPPLAKYVVYAAAWGLALAAAGRKSLGIEWKCERGHEMHPGAKFCEECGAPAVHQEAL